MSMVDKVGSQTLVACLALAALGGVSVAYDGMPAGMEPPAADKKANLPADKTPAPDKGPAADKKQAADKTATSDKKTPAPTNDKKPVAEAAGKAPAAPAAAQAPAAIFPAAHAAATTPAAGAAPELRAFTLKHADPEEVRKALGQVLTGAAPSPAAGPRPPAGAAYLPAPRAGASAPGGGTRVVADPGSRTVFVRGPAEDVEAAGALIGVLDGEPGTHPPAAKDLTVLHLRQAKAQEVTRVLTDLGIASGAVALPKSNTLILVQSGNFAKEVREVVDRLEAAHPGGPDPGRVHPAGAGPAAQAAPKAGRPGVGD